MAQFSISTERQNLILNGGYYTGERVWWYMGGNFIPAIYIMLTYENKAGIAIQGTDDTWIPKVVRLRNISRRKSL